MVGAVQSFHVAAAAPGCGPSPAGCGPVGSDQSLTGLGAVGCVAVGFIPITLIPWRLHRPSVWRTQGLGVHLGGGAQIAATSNLRVGWNPNASAGSQTPWALCFQISWGVVLEQSSLQATEIT